MPRIVGWEDAYAAAIAAHAERPYELGVSDCFVLGTDSALAITGESPLAHLRGTYSSMDEVAAIYAKLGAEHVGDVFALAYPEGSRAMARRGDLGVVDVAGDIVGVVVTGEDVIGKGVAGIVRAPRSALLKAYRVGWG